MLRWYRVMRPAALALAVLGLVGLIGLIGCKRGALQDDAGTGGITLPGADGAGATDLVDLPDVSYPTADANCGTISTVGSYLAPEILVVQDRSISNVTRWNDFLSAMAPIISNNGSLVDWGLYAFPQNGPPCGAGSVSTAIDVPIVPANATHVIAHMAAAGTGASGTPTAAAIQTAAAYMLSIKDQNPKFLMLLTDGAPTCAGTIDALVADPDRAQSDAIAAIDAAYAAGIPTLVVAPSTTTDANATDALNALADAGRYPRPLPGPKYHTELTVGQLLTLTDLATTCVFSLGVTPPPVPDVVTVMVNGATVPRDRSHVAGWDYTDSNATAIQLYGSWCDQLHSMRSNTVSVYFGCPGEG
jgi:hypothetical protein